MDSVDRVMTPAAIQEMFDLDADALVAELYAARIAYYESDQPLHADAEFDNMEEYLHELDPNEELEYWYNIGTSTPSIDKNNTDIKHTFPMYSAGKRKTAEEAAKWMHSSIEIVYSNTGLSRTDGIYFLTMPKIDGVSGGCKFKGYVQEYTTTRGDGFTGTDITRVMTGCSDIVREVARIPELEICNGNFEIRGEIYLPKDTDYDCNGKSLRNNANGILSRTKTINDDAKYLRYIVYDLIMYGLDNRPFRFGTMKETLDVLCKICPNVVPYEHLDPIVMDSNMTFRWDDKSSISRVYKNYLEKLRAEWNYETDGIIVVFDDTTLYDTINSSKSVHRFLHHLLAVKPPSLSQITILKHVIFETSKYGKAIPVAVVNPISVGGVTITRATLNNAQFVKASGVYPGVKIEIERANDVIPHVKTVINGKSGLYTPPIDCQCGAPLKQNGVHLECTDRKCMFRMSKMVDAYCKKHSIKGIGKSLSVALVFGGVVETLSDLYTITQDKLEYAGMASANSLKFINTMKSEVATKMSFIKLLGSIGIYSVGERVLANELNIHSIKDFYAFTPDKSKSRHMIIADWRDDPENIRLLNRLLDHIEIVEEDLFTTENYISVTGGAPLPRREIISILRRLGFDVVSLSGKSKYLLTDDMNSTSSSMKKAKKLDIPIYLYDDWTMHAVGNTFEGIKADVESKHTKYDNIPEIQIF